MSKRHRSYLLLSLASGAVAAALPACSGSDTTDNSKTPQAHAGSPGVQGSVVMPPSGGTAGATVVMTGVVVMPPGGGTGPCGGGPCGSIAMPPGGAGGVGGQAGGGPCNGHPCGVVVNPGGGAGGAIQFPGLVINPSGGAGGDGGAAP